MQGMLRDLSLLFPSIRVFAARYGANDVTNRFYDLFIAGDRTVEHHVIVVTFAPFAAGIVQAVFPPLLVDTFEQTLSPVVSHAVFGRYAFPAGRFVGRRGGLSVRSWRADRR